MRGGRLDRRIVLQQATLTYDSLNNPIQTWANLATVWAEKVELTGAERVAAAELGAERSCKFRIRYSSAVSVINPKDRFTFGGDTWQITSVTPLGRNEGFELSATVRTD